MNKHKNVNSSKPVKNFKQAFANLLTYIKPYLLVIIVAIILAIISSVFSIIGPNKLSDLTNTITKGISSTIDMKIISKIGITLIIIYAISFISNYIQGFIMAIVTNNISKNLRNKISLKINKLPLSYFDKTETGDILSRVTNDVDTIGQSLNQSVSSLVTCTTLFIGSIVMMFLTNAIMAVTAIFATIFGFIFMIIILKNSQKYFDEQQKELGNINGHIEEIYSGHNVVKVYNGVDDATKKFDEINNKLYNSSRKSHFLSGLMPPIMNFIGNFGYVAVCIVGSILVINNKLDFGSIVAFIVYVRLFSQPLAQLAEVATVLQSTAAASERVFEFIGEVEMNEENNKTQYLDPTKIKGNIEFINVKFGYGKDKLIIKNFNAYIKSGQKIAIVGPTGAGKTTIVNLLMKFYEINSGDITIDNVSINDLTRENIHDLFVMVLQDTWIFHDTIKNNIKYNNKATDKEIISACKTVGLDHFIKTLPNGYDTDLNDNENLSSGQKQLLTIVRGMIKNAPLLILDEATSNVDTRTEVLVQKAMDKLMQGKTSFIIAHRLSTIKNADLILVMNNGNIVEQGKHEDLIAKNGFYAELYNSQFKN